MKNRLRLLGAVLLLTAIGGAAWLYFVRPVSRFDVIDPEQLRQTAKSLSPLQTWIYWEKMKEGLDRRTDQTYAAACPVPLVGSGGCRRGAGRRRA